MWVILAYDINEKRVHKVRKICLPFLKGLQNSVFTGDISKANLNILMTKLRREIDPAQDSVQVFLLREQKLARRISIGVEKEFSNII